MAKKGRRATNEERLAAIQMHENRIPADRESYSSVPRTRKGVAVGDLFDAVLCRR